MKITIPIKDALFYNFQLGLMVMVLAKAVAWKLDMDWINTLLLPARVEYETAYALWQNIHTRTPDVIKRKRAARKAYEKLLRLLIKILKASPNITDEEREEMQLSIDKGGYHAATPVTDTPPAVEYDTSIPGRLTTTLSEKDSTSKGMPHGAGSAEVRSAVLDHEPADSEELTSSVTIYQVVYVQDFNVSMEGKVLYSMYRWVSPTGEKGPWSLIYRIVIL
jgi:hypothetical protein